MASSSPDAGRRLSPEGLRDLLAIVNSSRGLDEILSYVVIQAYQVLGSDGVGLYLRDPNDEQTLRVQAAHGVPVEVQNLSCPVGPPIIGMAVAKGRTVVVSDFSTALAQPLAQRFDDQIEDRGTYLEVLRPGPVSANNIAQRELNQRMAATYSTLAAVPLVAHDEAYGTLVLYYYAPHAYGAEQVDLSQAFAQQAALAIENARLRSQAEQRLHEIERRQRVAEGLRDLLAVVNSNHDLDEILAEVLAQSSRLLGNDASAVYLHDDDNAGVLHARASSGLDRDILALQLRVGAPTTGLAVQQGRTLVCHDLAAALGEDSTRSTDTQLEELPGYARIVRMSDRTDPDVEAGFSEPRVRRLVDRLRAVVSTPLMARGRPFGALTIFYAQPHTFTVEEVDLARAFAEQAALAIENARLHADVEQRMRENERRRRVAEGMRDLLASVNSTRSLDEVLDLVLAQASDLLSCDADSVLLLDGKDGQHAGLSVRASRGLVPEIAPVRLPVGAAITGVAVERGQPVAVSDLLAALPVKGEPLPLLEERPGYLHMQRIGDPEPRFADAAGLPRVSEIATYYRALLAIPLVVRGRIQGALTLYYSRPRGFSREDIAMALAFADQTALAIENARLHSESEQRRHELEALYRADEALHRSLRLDDVLRALADVAQDVLHADKTSVHIWDSEHKHLVMAAAHGYSAETLLEPLVPGEDLVVADVLSSGVIAISDGSDPSLISAHTREVVQREGIRAWIGAPIRVSGQLFGMFGVAYCEPHTPSADEKRLVFALAQRAGLAIHNARLFEQAPLVATAEERQRLARELHDAVTQTLFSASLIAEVVPRIWERDPREGRQRLEELRRLTRGALAEMRTLLLELRPTALVETPFAHLLRQLAEATASRTNLLVDVRAQDGDQPLPPEVQIALYRIAQETLSNTGKHAGASRAAINFRRRPDRVSLHLSDNGRGFDPRSTPSGHLGLGIMHERARDIGARLRIESRPGDGTRIHVYWRGNSA